MHTFSLTHSPPSLSLFCCRNGKCTTECASAPVELLHNGYYLGAARDAQWTSDRKYLASSAHIKQQQTYTEWEQSQHSDSWVGARARVDTLSPGHSRRELARKWPNDVSQQSGRQSGRQSRFKCKCANEIKATQPKPVGKPPFLPLSYSLPSHMAPLCSTLIESSVWAAIVVVSSIFCCAQLLAQLPLLQTVLAAMPEIIKLANL